MQTKLSIASISTLLCLVGCSGANAILFATKNEFKRLIEPGHFSVSPFRQSSGTLSFLVHPGDLAPEHPIDHRAADAEKRSSLGFIVPAELYGSVEIAEVEDSNLIEVPKFLDLLNAPSLGVNAALEFLPIWPGVFHRIPR